MAEWLDARGPDSVDASGRSLEQPVYLSPILCKPMFPVKNGFIHFQESEEESSAPQEECPPTNSAPGVMMQGNFRVAPGVVGASDARSGVSEVETIDSSAGEVSDSYRSSRLNFDGRLTDVEDDPSGVVNRIPHNLLQAELEQDSIPVPKLETLGPSPKLRYPTLSLDSVPEARDEGKASSSSPSSSVNVQIGRPRPSPLGAIGKGDAPRRPSVSLESPQSALDAPPQQPPPKPPQSPPPAPPGAVRLASGLLAVGGPVGSTGAATPEASQEADRDWDDASLQVISIGSAQHGDGKCSPCAWFWKSQGCRNGLACQRCHLCPAGTLKEQKKAKKDSMTSKSTAAEAIGELKPKTEKGAAEESQAWTNLPMMLGCTDAGNVKASDHLTVKNTFFHWSESPLQGHGPEVSTAPASLFSQTQQDGQGAGSGQLGTIWPWVSHPPNAPPPSPPMSEDEDEEHKPGDVQLLLHEQGQCKPCAYFWYKKDGCRKDSDCQFCHLCEKGESKKRKKERVKLLKQNSRHGTIDVNDAVNDAIGMNNGTGSGPLLPNGAQLPPTLVPSAMENAARSCFSLEAALPATGTEGELWPLH